MKNVEKETYRETWQRMKDFEKRVVVLTRTLGKE